MHSIKTTLIWKFLKPASSRCIMPNLLHPMTLLTTFVSYKIVDTCRTDIRSN